MKQYESQFRKLTEVGSVNRGKSKHRPRNAPELYGGLYPFIQTGDVKHANFFITDYTQTYSERGLAQSKLWQPGTLCITIAANIADTAILKIPACFPDSIIGFIPKKGESDVRFTKYCLDTYKKEMQLISQGTTQDNLSQGKLLSLRFRIPEYELQRKIAAILSAYDELIENNQRRIALLKKMAEEIYREWFVRLRFPSYEQARFVKGVPDGWEVKRISEVVDFLSGYSFKSETYTPSGNYGVVTIKNVQDGYFIPECSDFIEDVPSNVKRHCYLDCSDVLMSLTGNVGRVCHVYGTNLLLNQRVAKLVPKLENASQFIFYTFNNESMLQLIENLSLGSTAQMNLSPILLGKQKMVVPSNEILKKYEDMTIPMFKETMSLLQLNMLLQKTRDRLLPRLISGKLSVENLDIQFPPSMVEDAHG
jgi:type I restriction enzyme S subunit